MVPTSVERFEGGTGCSGACSGGNPNIERALKRGDAGINDQISSRDKSSGMI